MGDSCFRGQYRVVVSEIAEQDEDTAASAAAVAALAGSEGTLFEVDDYEINCKSGTISSDATTTAVIGESVAEGIIANLAGMEDSLSADEQAGLIAGEAFLYVDSAEISADDVAETVKTAIEEAAAEADVSAGGNLSFMNIGLFAQLGECARRPVSEAADEDAARISVDTSKLAPMPAGTTRTVQIIRYHNGEAEVLDDVTLDGAVATFSSSLFSPYAVVYRDERTTQNEDDVASVTWRYCTNTEDYKVYKTAYYSSFEAAAHAACESSYKEELPAEDQTAFRYYSAPVIKLFKNVTVDNKIDLDSDTALYLDLNGKELTITKDGELSGDSDEYPTNICLDSTVPGKINSAGTIGVAFSMWTGDVFNITGGTILNSFGMDGGTLNITGGTVNFGGCMINNGGAADISANIYGDAMISNMDYVCYLDDEGNIQEDMHSIMLNLYGGYYDTDPRSYRTGNMGYEFDQSAYVNLDESKLEEYADQTDWAADPDIYTWRITGGEVPGPDPGWEPMEDEELKYSTISNQTYTGAQITPEPKVKFGEKELVKGVDYTLSYKNNINVAEKEAANAPTVIVTGKGLYQSTLAVPFAIKPRKINNGDDFADDFTVSCEDRAYTGGVIKQKPVVLFKDGAGKVVILKETKDYTLSWSGEKDGEPSTDPKDPGTVTVTVTGKGNFTGSAATTYEIVEKNTDPDEVDLKNAVIVVSTDSELTTYKGREFEQDEVEELITVYESKAAQKEDDPVDPSLYNVTYDPKDTLKAGTVKVNVHGKNGHAELWKTVSFKILPKPVVDEDEIEYVTAALAEGEEPVYTGKPLKPAVVVTDDDTGEEISASNYTVSYIRNTNAEDESATKEVRGEEVSIAPTATLTFKGNYKGKLSMAFTIEPMPVNGDELTITQADIKDTGKEIDDTTLKPVVKLGKTTLKKGEDKDYVISFERDENKEMQTATIVLGGNYEGSGDYGFRIYDADSILDLSDETFTVSAETEKATEGGKPVYVYTGNKICPVVTVTASVDGANDHVLVPGRDYTVTYSNNTGAGGHDLNKAPGFKVTGKGAYKGSRTDTFTILPKELSDDTCNITVSDGKYNKGNEVKPKVTVTDRTTGKALKLNTDYTVTYDRNRNRFTDDDPSQKPETAPVVKIKGKGNYTTDGVDVDNECKKYFRIYDKDINSAKAVGIGNIAYTGKQITLADFAGFVIYPDNKDKNPLSADNYTVEYGENKDVGTGTITFRGKGDYGNTKVVKFKITPKIFKK
ncbi:MAG: hypothetical protein K5886_07415 [Lachnospiraceae bacterium]|nr:hypothetical protein [Lachnospiraceae bacterium]